MANWRPVGGLTNAEVKRIFETHIYTPPVAAGSVVPGTVPPVEIPALTEAQHIPNAGYRNIRGAQTVQESKALIPKKFTFSNENIAKSEAAAAARASGAGAAMQEEKKRKRHSRRNRKNRKTRRTRR